MSSHGYQQPSVSHPGPSLSFKQRKSQQSSNAAPNPFAKSHSSTVAEQSDTQTLGSRPTSLTDIEAGPITNATLGEAVTDIAKKNIEPWMTNRLDTAAEELKTTVANQFQWSITSEAEKFIHRRLPELNAEIEPFAERVKSKLQPEITQQIDSAMATVKKEMMECFDEFKASIEPWITYRIETAIVNHENLRKAEKAIFKRNYEAYQQGRHNN
ncbi:hypothetical protein FPOAC2_12691 [Fusarium poae]|uniref:hypothetical protein n=1 Tax=Fusarium poae TaxID=36050 RepID=UPI001CEBC658|nr:hypothetical protein FPOAC1_012356 [Fusarium poae]KAG8667523.1 hypothetical protein FPOAC1_012356 [Fusarium poae]